MTFLMVDPNDSGALYLDPSLVDTVVNLGEGTRDLTYRLRPPVLRRPWSNTGHKPTGEVPVWPTGAERAVGFQRPKPPPPPPPPNPPLPPRVEPVTERLTLDVRPKHFHPRHRRPLPLPALLTACFGAGGMGGVSVLAVAVAVAQ